MQVQVAWGKPLCVGGGQWGSRIKSGVDATWCRGGAGKGVAVDGTQENEAQVGKSRCAVNKCGQSEEVGARSAAETTTASRSWVLISMATAMAMRDFFSIFQKCECVKGWGRVERGRKWERWRLDGIRGRLRLVCCGS